MTYKVCTPIEYEKEGETKTRWHQIGNGWSDGPGLKITVTLNSLPYRSEYIYLFPDDGKDGRK